MRWISIAALFLVLTLPALAARSDEQYLDVYNEILLADSLLESGHSEAAAARYLQAQSDLQKLQTEHPSWNPDVVKFRLDYLAEKLQPLGKLLPAANAPSAVAPESGQPAPPPQPAAAPVTQQIAGLREQIRSLTDANADLQAKLKEALSVQPSAVSPAELAKAKAKTASLEKERDLLAVALEREKSARAGAVAAPKAAAVSEEMAALKARAEVEEKKFRSEIARLKVAVVESESKLADANQELQALKSKNAAESAKQAAEQPDQFKQQVSEISKDEAEIARLKESLVEAEKKLADANNELDVLKATRAAEAQPTDSTKSSIQERDKLKEELAERSKDLANAEAHSNQQLSRLRAALEQALRQRDELEKKLAAAPVAQASPAPASPESSAMAQQVEQLQARIAVLEANPVPYTAEELALLEKSPGPAAAAAPAVTPATASPSPPVALPATPPLTPPVAPTAASPAVPSAEVPTPANQPRHVYSSKDLPPGAGALWADALRASMERDYETAEQKFKEVLRQDETNVYVLAHLAEAQLAAGHLEDCEQTLRRALAVDPNDPATLYSLGLLRYRQDKLEDALAALSLSAKFNPTNAATQNYLGCVLAGEGLRPAAETALRKALQSDPEYADAHFNLAVVYAGNKPPSPELARWHYKRAIALGHAKNAGLEKLIEENP
ncbi:MAG: tetratricopeptide repeat protein [Verrucomicrobiota bacterium]|jgi:tetratricopeptide (TPR) repeat protein